jgi:hypothetical protein
VIVGRRLAVLLAVAGLAAALAASASAALFFLFTPRTAAPGQLVTVRLGGTPPGFALTDRRKPFGRPMRIYVVPNAVADDVESRLDPRLHFVGLVVPDRDGRGVLTFRAPPLDTASYAVAAWCPGCAATSLGKSFFVLGVTPFTRSRFPGMLLRLRLPDATRSCPVTTGRYGNGVLSVDARGGVLTRPREPDGTLFDKLGWLPRKGFTGTLAVRGERLDGPGRMNVLGVNWGYSFAPGRAPRGSWASAVKFPSEGCWRITGRVRDVALTYVVRVVASS